jgi:outer membrane protein OmpA-like peptidoglycan-associated protein
VGADPFAELGDAAPKPSVKFGTSSSTAELGNGARTGPDQSPSHTQEASLPPPSAEPAFIRVFFEDGSANLTRAAMGELRKLAGDMQRNLGLRMQVIAYAGAKEAVEGTARTLSLSRGLAVRSFLIDQGVRAVRLDVRAHGDRFDDGPPARVDITPARH